MFFKILVFTHGHNCTCVCGMPGLSQYWCTRIAEPRGTIIMAVAHLALSCAPGAYGVSVFNTPS